MNRNVIAGILTIAVGLLVYRQGAKLPPAGFGDPVGAGAFPMFWACVLMGLGAILIAAEVFRKKDTAAREKSFVRETVVAVMARYRNVFFVFALLWAQVWAMRVIGFAASSFLFIPACAFVLGANKPKTFAVAGVISAVVVAALYCFFTYAMKMPLPA
ncbi:tripartite tricarboxylate transporter TctB family protein [Desulfovibrio sp. OttesenSCG-928-O18]|nr:tripartite tricarboxylate transporter TctB family protein [Desulfovibrio sp. OttesenSCG-928-O18]